MMDFYQFTQQMWQTYFADVDENGRHPMKIDRSDLHNHWNGQARNLSNSTSISNGHV